MTIRLLTLFTFTLLLSLIANAQAIDSTLDYLQQIPAKYINDIDKKITQYSNRVTSKTEKTLTKLSRWENKIKPLLQEASPETADRLFGEGKITFTTLLQQLQQGEAIALHCQASYNKYRDDVTISLDYLAQQKDQLDNGMIKKLKATSNKMQDLAIEEEKNEAIQQFIKERKKQLIDGAFQYIGNSKYLKKINKEIWYYAESIKNYKELFAEPTKMEESVKRILKNIPAFQKFAQENSVLSRFFTPSSSFPTLSLGGSVPIVNGLALRNTIQNLMQTNFPSAIPDPIQQLQKTESKAAIEKLQKEGNGSKVKSDPRLPAFKVNSQRTKSYRERIEFGADFQFGQATNYFPASMTLGAKIGYKLNDKISSGFGLSYIIGLGQGWKKIDITSNGIGLRAYLKWKLFKSFDLQGGGEWNHLGFYNVEQLKNTSEWQQSALLGMSKSYALNKNLSGYISFQYDFLYNHHIPVSQPFVFRVGYGF